MGSRKPWGSPLLLGVGLVVQFLHPNHPAWLKDAWTFLGLAMVLGGVRLVLGRRWALFFAVLGALLVGSWALNRFIALEVWAAFVLAVPYLLFWPAVALAGFAEMSDRGEDARARAFARLAVAMTALMAVFLGWMALDGDHYVDGVAGGVAALVWLLLALAIAGGFQRPTPWVAESEPGGRLGLGGPPIA